MVFFFFYHNLTSVGIELLFLRFLNRIHLTADCVERDSKNYFHTPAITDVQVCHTAHATRSFISMAYFPIGHPGNAADKGGKNLTIFLKNAGANNLSLILIYLFV